MFLALSVFTIGIGYVAYRLSRPFKHRTVWFFIITGLLAATAGFLFKALFLF